jgi:hypothetical protein
MDIRVQGSAAIDPTANRYTDKMIHDIIRRAQVERWSGPQGRKRHWREGLGGVLDRLHHRPLFRSWT